MLVRSCLKSCMLGFSILWTKKFQMSNLGSEKEKELEIKLPTFAGLQRKQGNSRKMSIPVSLTMLKPLTLWIMTSWGKLLERREYQTILPVSWETCMWAKKQQLEPYMEQLTGSRLRKEYDRTVCCHTICLTYRLGRSREMLGWMSYKLESRCGRNTNNLRYADDTTLTAESKELMSLFFKIKFIYFNWSLITIQYCSGFWPYIDMNQPWVYMCPPSWITLPPPSPSHPSGSCECTSPEHPVLSQLKTAAAAAKSFQSCPTLCNPTDGSPPGSTIPGILQARTLEWVAISFSNAWKWKVKVKSLSCVQLFATPWTAAYQAPLPMGFSRQAYWSGLPLTSPT